jgi:hypothetical protein
MASLQLQIPPRAKTMKRFVFFIIMSSLSVFLMGSSIAYGESVTFSPKAEALPFPPDAREVEFDATFDDIEFTSQTSLAALADFYLQELTKRGWSEDESEREIEDDSVEMTFNHDDAQVVVELDGDDEEISVSFDCEGLDFSKASDPTSLIAAGVPQPRAYVYLQKQVSRPAEIQDIEYERDSLLFKSTLSFTDLFDFYMKELKAKGWRESRRPIMTTDRRYTEFQRGGEKLSVNVFAHEIGSRIILTYETTAKEQAVPPLAEVSADSPFAKLARKTGLASGPAASPVATTPIQVTKNTGSATFTLGAKKYSFTHAAAYRSRQDGDNTTQLLFADRPILLARIQELLASQENPDIEGIFGENWPGYLRINVGEYMSFSFNSGGVGIGNSIDKPDNKLKFDKDRVSGTLKMAEPQEAFGDKFTLEVTIDAPVLTPTTRIVK